MQKGCRRGANGGGLGAGFADTGVARGLQERDSGIPGPPLEGSDDDATGAPSPPGRRRPLRAVLEHRTPRRLLEACSKPRRRRNAQRNRPHRSTPDETLPLDESSRTYQAPSTGNRRAGYKPSLLKPQSKALKDLKHFTEFEFSNPEGLIGRWPESTLPWKTPNPTDTRARSHLQDSNPTYRVNPHV